MKYCSNCGSKRLEFKVPKGDVHKRWVCNQCKMIHYSNPNIIAGCIPIWEDKIMLAKRSIGPKKGMWNLPAGFMENGETVSQGALREVREETLCEVDLGPLITIFSIPRARQVHMHFVGEMKDDKSFGNGIETSDVQLFLEEDIPWDDIAFETSKFTIRNYLEDRKKGEFKVHIGDLT